MKIEVKDIRSNSFRPDLPLNESKVKQLEANIESTGFWDNIVARKVDGHFELAYGHHRLQALKNLKVKEIDVPVRPLTDKVMLQMMAQENMEEMEGSPIWAMEIVKTTYLFLNKGDDRSSPPGRKKIAKFLAWSDFRVEEALANLRSTGEIEPSKFEKEKPPNIEKEIFKKLPSQRHASEFRRAVKDMGASPRVQREVVKEFSKGVAKKYVAQELIEAKQLELGERKAPEKSRGLVLAEEMKYQSILAEIILKLPKEPPNHLSEKGYTVLRAMAITIINRLRRFEDGTK